MRIRVNAFCVFLLLALAACRDDSRDGWISPRLGTRTGSERCWVSYPTRAAESLCVSRDVFHRWLAGRSISEGEPFVIRTRARARAEILPGGARKIPETLFELDRVPFRPSALEAAVRAIESLREGFSRRLEPGDSLGIFRRLFLDERVHPQVFSKRNAGAVDPAEWRGVGWVHLFSASGIHLIFWGTWVFTAVFRLSRARGIPPPFALQLARFCTGVAWAFAWLMAGAKVGMLRPLGVIAIRAAVKERGASARLLAPLALACTLDGVSACLARRSDGVFEAFLDGREHYALAVAGGLLALEGAQLARSSAVGTRLQKIREHLAMAIGSWLFTWPLGFLPSPAGAGLGVFLVAPLTPLLSLLSIPWVGGFLHPAGLMILSLDALLGGDRLTRNILAPCLAWTSSALLAVHEAVLHSGLSLVCIPAAAAGAGLGFALLVPWIQTTMGRVCLGLALLAFQLLPVGPAVEPGPSRVVQLDVGQGDSALIIDRERGGAGLIDTGSAHALSRWEWIETFAREGVSRLDFVALTHGDEDHAGGLSVLARTLHIECVDGAAEPAPDGLCFPYAMAESREPHPAGWRGKLGNSDMFGFYVRLRDERGRLFDYANLGDADQRAERAFLPWLLERTEPALPLYFKASHHGSRTSSDPSLVAAIHPREVWVSVGVGNRYGHPAPEVLERWRLKRRVVRTTALEGGLQAGP